MSHEIDMSNARANIAYRGEAPWHELGYEIQDDEPTDVWVVKAGLAHNVHDSVVRYNAAPDGQPVDEQFMPARRVLFRSDTKKPLSVVSAGYHVVQPREVVDFFTSLCDVNGFKMEVAGALSDGKRVWALARTGGGQNVLGDDIVCPFVLCATSYDGTMATTVQETYVRVVCNNTIQAALEEAANKANAVRRITIPHDKKFDAERVKMDLNLVASNFEHFIESARKMARTPVDAAFAKQFLKMLLPVPAAKIVDGKAIEVKVEETRGFQQILELFERGPIGAELEGGHNTAWSLLNACTEAVDHLRGRSASTRLSSAWFGEGNALKNRARDLILATI